METVLYALLAYIWVIASTCITHLMTKRKYFNFMEKTLIFFSWPILFPTIRLIAIFRSNQTKETEK